MPMAVFALAFANHAGFRASTPRVQRLDEGIMMGQRSTFKSVHLTNVHFQSLSGSHVKPAADTRADHRDHWQVRAISAEVNAW